MVRERVHDIIADIRVRGDAAVRQYSEQFDRWAPESYRLSDSQISTLIGRLPEQVVDDIRFVQDQVRNFAGREVSADSVGPYDYRDGEGSGSGAGHRQHPANPR